MQDDLHPFDGSEDQTPLTPELEALERRLLLDAAQWDAESPDTGTLAAYALALADAPAAAVVPDGKVLTGPASVSSRPTPRLRPLVPRQPSAWAVYIVTLCVVVAMAVVLLWPSLLPHTPAIGNPTPMASATAATDTPLPAGTPTASPTRTIVGSGAGFTVTRVIPAVDLTQTPEAVVGSNLTTYSSISCGQTAKIVVEITFDTSNWVNRGKITYRWSRSDGFVSDPKSFYFGNTAVSPQLRTLEWVEWDLPAIQADGSAKWVDVEVLEPNPITARLNLQATCQFSVQDGKGSVSPAAYNCTVGGDQTFTFSGTIIGSYAPGSHTVTYHWHRSDGSVTADQTVTFGEGVISVPVQPDQWTINQTGGGWDQVVTTSPNFAAVSQSNMSPSCP